LIFKNYNISTHFDLTLIYQESFSHYFIYNYLFFLQETFNNGGGGSSMQQQQQHHHYQHYHHHQQQQQQQQKMQQQRTSSGHLGATSTMHPSDSGDGVIMIEQVIRKFIESKGHSNNT